MKGQAGSEQAIGWRLTFVELLGVAPSCSAANVILENGQTSSISLTHYRIRTINRGLLRNIVWRIPDDVYSRGYDHRESFQDIEIPLMSEQVTVIAGRMLDQPVNTTQLWLTKSA